MDGWCGSSLDQVPLARNLQGLRPHASTLTAVASLESAAIHSLVHIWESRVVFFSRGLSLQLLILENFVWDISL